MQKTMLVVPNHALPRTRDPRIKIDWSRTTEKGNLAPFRTSPKKLGKSRTNYRAVRRLNGLWIPASIGPVGDGPVETWFDSKLLKLH